LEKTLFGSLSISKTPNSPAPKYKIIFPTADEVRRSLDGYQSGASIHTKIQTPAQAKQLLYLKPMLHHWAGDKTQKPVDTAVGSLSNGSTRVDASCEVRKAGRRRAAPHIKTYIRFTDAAKSEIDWALVTSANISKQAWGEAVNKAGEVRISSYELGVLVWPGLYRDDAKMVPTFKQDTPLREQLSTETGMIVGFRMPYDLPLVHYSSGDEPWCATRNYEEPDWRGSKWHPN
jgi:tyrosyl-DNA phosphodiesterase-1